MNLATDVWFHWLAGFLIGAVVTAAGAMYIVKAKLAGRDLTAFVKKSAPALIAALAAVVLFGEVAPTLAQTPVPITIDTNEIFTQTNNWITQFTPIQAIGIGASLALAILGFLAAVLTGAFKGNR